MKPLDKQTDSEAKLRECAEEVIETILTGMKAVREEMRRGKPAEISVPQFRVLAFLKRHPGSSLSSIAEHIGLTLPSMSIAVDGLVKRGLVTREPSTDDRRKLVLHLTDDGGSSFEQATEATRTRFVAMLSRMDPNDRAGVGECMRLLRRAFSESGKSEGE